MEKLSSYWNTAHVSIKVVVTLVGFVGYGALFYFQTSTHGDDINLHTSVQDKLEKIQEHQELYNTMQVLRDRIEVLEKDLSNQIGLTKRRHDNQKEDIAKFNRKVDNYENNLKEVRGLIFEAFIKEVTENK